MLGSGDEPDPNVIKRRLSIAKKLYHKSTTNHEKGRIAIPNKNYTAILLNLEDVIITDVKNTSNNDQRKHDPES